MRHGEWHALPIWVMESTTSRPRRRRVPRPNEPRSRPDRTIFSAKSPGDISRRPSRRTVSMSSWESRLTCRCQGPAWASPSIPCSARNTAELTACFRTPLVSPTHNASTRGTTILLSLPAAGFAALSFQQTYGADLDSFCGRLDHVVHGKGGNACCS